MGIWLLCAWTLETAAQAPGANFTANVTSGCAPLTVNFRDQSTGNPTSWNWELSNGTLSSVQNPTVTFSQPGTYSVKLVVQNANGFGQIERIDYITVHPSPIVNFAANLTMACLPAVIQFTDQSTTPVGTITSWQWDFGDGATSTAQNPAHTYAQTGFYTVTLRVTSSTGCSQIRVRSAYIRVVGNIDVAFNAFPGITCRPPFGVNFVNQSNGPGNITYSWNFGNGQTATGYNAATNYTSTGTYNVTLNAVSDLGCTGSLQKTVTLTGATTDFQSPSETCPGAPVNFQNNSSHAPLTSFWDFGDGTSSGQINATKTYLTPGTYTVKLINQYQHCTDSIIKTITVNNGAGADFSADDSSFCAAPATVRFSDLTPNAVSWLWNFGDGTTSTEQNPVHTYNNVGTYSVSLIATSSAGCIDTIRKANFITIQEPTASFNLPKGGCAPVTFTPSATVNSNDPIVSWAWDLNAPGGIFNVQYPPPFTYTSVGSYRPTLTITTASGCTKVFRAPEAILVGTPPTVGFSIAPPESCASDTFRFVNNSVTTPGSQVIWEWNFGDGGTSDLENPTHVFTDTGSLNVILTVINNGCAVSDTVPVIAYPPVAEFSFDIDCNNRTIQFTDASLVDPVLTPLSWQWSFGDPANTTFSGQNPPPISYPPGPGSYPVTLTVVNGQCEYTVTNPVVFYDERANFRATSADFCSTELIHLEAIGSNPDNVAWYAWSVNGVPLADSTRTVQFRRTTVGTYDVTLTISDLNGCLSTHTIQDAFNITSPAARFEVIRDADCKTRRFTFTDQSTSNVAITNWEFDFGDGTVRNFTAPPFQYTYANSGSYIVRMTITDASGCRNSYTYPGRLFVSNPTAGFRADTFYCPGVPISFVDTSVGVGLNYFWDFGDGTTSTEANPQHAYPIADADYTVKLVVTDISGCQDSLVRQNYIKIRSPKAAFAIRDTTSICPPLRTSFEFQGRDYDYFYWEFGDGGSSSQANASNFYGTPGSYTPILHVVGKGGCEDTASSNVTIHDTRNIRLDYSPTRACNSLEVEFNITIPEGFKFILNFGDGTADSSRRTNLTHLYGRPSYSRPFITIFDSIAGCQTVVNGTNRIEVMGAVPLFGADRKAFCDTGVVRFTDFTVKNEDIITRLWTFGDGGTSSEVSPAHNFTIPGVYHVRLDVTTVSNCSSSFIDTILVYRTPDPSISARDSICVFSTENFVGSLAVPDSLTNWSWNFGNGQSGNTQEASSTFNNVGNHTVTLTASNALGCSDTSTHVIYVSAPPTATPVQDPITIISGGSTPLQMVYTGNITRYTWTPEYRLNCLDCAEPIANPQSTTRYRLDIEDNLGCVNNSALTVNVVCNNLNYQIPNTFSPNGDGRNDRFFPRGSGLFRIKSLLIFNRWGQVVFEKRDFNPNDAAAGWDGMFKGQPASPDVYIYTMDIICDNNLVIPLKGNVTLIR